MARPQECEQSGVFPTSFDHRLLLCSVGPSWGERTSYAPALELNPKTELQEIKWGLGSTKMCSPRGLPEGVIWARYSDSQCIMQEWGKPSDKGCVVQRW
jgi:hypothetical protein